MSWYFKKRLSPTRVRVRVRVRPLCLSSSVSVLPRFLLSPERLVTGWKITNNGGLRSVSTHMSYDDDFWSEGAIICAAV